MELSFTEKIKKLENDMSNDAINIIKNHDFYFSELYKNDIINIVNKIQIIHRKEKLNNINEK
jgi:hypothetical protein